MDYGGAPVAGRDALVKMSWPPATSSITTDPIIEVDTAARSAAR